MSDDLQFHPIAECWPMLEGSGFKPMESSGPKPLPPEETMRLLRILIDRLRKLDAEAATHVETVIAMRTAFNGEPPYVGWEGLGLALTEALDERDRLREALAGAVEMTERSAKEIDRLETEIRALKSQP